MWGGAGRLLGFRLTFDSGRGVYCLEIASVSLRHLQKMSGENILSGIVGGVIGGSVGYKSGYSAGYRKKEEEDKWIIGALQIQLAIANQMAENLRAEIERLRKENENLRNEKSLLQRI